MKRENITSSRGGGGGGGGGGEGNQLRLIFSFNRDNN